MNGARGNRGKLPKSDSKRAKTFIHSTPEEQITATAWDARTGLTLLVINSRRISELAYLCPVTEGGASDALVNLGLVQHCGGEPTRTGGKRPPLAEEMHQIADDLAALIDTFGPQLGISVSEVFEPFFDNWTAEL